MPWSETTPGHFERSFDTLETFYRTIGTVGNSIGREHYAVSAVLRLHFDPVTDDPAASLRHAWKTMRFDFPQIAAHGDGSTYTYDTPNAVALESWLASTFIVAPPTTTVEELYGSFKPDALATMHYLPHSCEILFHSSHWRIDGTGTLHFLKHFLKTLSSPRHAVDFGTESMNLSPSLDEALNVPLEATPAAEQAATDLIANFIAYTPSIGLPVAQSSDSGRVLGATRRCEVQLSLQQSAAIVVACKKRGFSVTTATHAAVVSVTREMAVKNPAKSYVSWLAFDLRRYCSDAIISGKHAVSNYHTGLPAVVQLSTYDSHANQLKAIYSRPLNEPRWNVFSFLASYVRKVCELFSQQPPPGVLPPSEPNLNSLGVVDQFFDLSSQENDGNRVEVLGFWIGVEVLTQIVMVYVWTRQGKMSLSACYNESFYEEDYVMSFLVKLRDCLTQALSV